MNLKNLILIGVLFASPAFAEDGNLAKPTPAMVAAMKPAQTVAQCLSMLTALRNLDGHVVILKQNGQETTIMQPWDFGSGALRLHIASDVTALAGYETSIESVRQAILKELLSKMPPDKDGKPPMSIPPGSPEFESFTRQYTEALNQPCGANLVRIKASELRLDKNEIPVTALSALAPILDDDVSK